MVIHDTAEPRGSECEEERSDGEGGVGHEEGGRDGEVRGRHDGEGMEYREDSGEGTGGWRVVTGRRGGKQTGTGRGTESSTRDGGGVHAANEWAVGETMERGTDRDDAGQHSTTDNTSTPARRARRTEEEEEDTDGEDEEGSAMLRRWMREMQQRGRRGKDGGTPQDTQQGGNTRDTQQRRAEAGKGGASSSAAAGVRTQEKGRRRGRNAPRDGEAGSGETARRRSASAAERTGGGGKSQQKNTVNMFSAGQIFRELGVEVKRSTLNRVLDGGTRRWARAGAREAVEDTGDGLFATQRFHKGQEILDYRYIGGRQVMGEEVEWLTREQFRDRYPPEEGMPEGRGTHVLRTRGKKPTYYDTSRTGGVGGKANTKQGGCNVRAMVVASRRGGQPSKVRGSTLTHPQPIPHPYPHPRRRFCRFCRVPPDPSRAPCSGAHFCDTGSGITRLLLRVRERSRRLRISKARAARVGVRRAGIRGRGGERRGRDCDLVLCRAGAVRGRRERFGQYV